jgi:hypothetical protein
MSVAQGPWLGLGCTACSVFPPGSGEVGIAGRSEC